jgi:hypothetical protein
MWMYVNNVGRCPAAQEGVQECGCFWTQGFSSSHNTAGLLSSWNKFVDAVAVLRCVALRCLLLLLWLSLFENRLFNARSLPR